MQIVAVLAMEAPVEPGHRALWDKKIDVFRAMPDVDPERCARGQYEGYLRTPGVKPNSQTETYVALRLTVENWRWAGVPFYIRTGKRLASRKTQIAIKFRGSPAALFRGTQVREPAPNWLLIRVQPDEGMSLEFGAKVPGPVLKVGDVRMDFRYKDYFGTAPRTGYETLLYDIMMGDATLFQRADNVEAGWSVVQPVLDFWTSNAPQSFPNYAAGSQGPHVGDQLIENDGRSWRPIN
jgi:glucose-6-phosphate 1-dehydrogenase